MHILKIKPKHRQTNTHTKGHAGGYSPFVKKLKRSKNCNIKKKLWQKCHLTFSHLVTNNKNSSFSISLFIFFGSQKHLKHFISQWVVHCNYDSSRKPNSEANKDSDLKYLNTIALDNKKMGPTEQQLCTYSTAYHMVLGSCDQVIVHAERIVIVTLARTVNGSSAQITLQTTSITPTLCMRIAAFVVNLCASLQKCYKKWGRGGTGMENQLRGGVGGGRRWENLHIKC